MLWWSLDLSMTFCLNLPQHTVKYVRDFIKGMQKKKFQVQRNFFLNWRICQKEFPAQIYFQYFHQNSFIEKGSLFFLNFQTNLKLSTVLKMHWICSQFDSNVFLSDQKFLLPLFTDDFFNCTD